MSGAPSTKDLSTCFQGVVPSLLATADTAGVPNITYLSQVFYVDNAHVALSRQFFNKTSRNLDTNSVACCEVYDPLTMQAFRLRLRFLRSETEGPVFDRLSMRIDSIAEHTGMTGIFRLIAADICEVLDVERVDGFLTEGDPQDTTTLSLSGIRKELRGLQLISEQINRACHLEALLDGVLETLDEYFEFANTMILLHDDSSNRLVTLASRGYAESGVGAEVALGQGVIGKAAQSSGVLRLGGLNAELRYGRAVRREVIVERGTENVRPEIPLPGLPHAQSVLVIPLRVGARLIGALAAESRAPVGFNDWDETYFDIVGNQLALAIDRMSDGDEAEEPDEGQTIAPSLPAALPKKRVALVYYTNDDCVFADGNYLIRNIPGRILWTLLRAWREDGRTEFTNRELRLDESLGLPEYRDNLESRLILLRRRLAENDAGVTIERTGRGRFRIVIDAELDMIEK